MRVQANVAGTMTRTGSDKKVAKSLVALSSAAILTVYAAGLMKTRAAAEQMEEASNERRPPMPAPATAGEITTPPPIEPPAGVAKPTHAKSPAIRVVPVTKPAPTETTALKAAPVEATPTKTTKATPPEATLATGTTSPARISDGARRDTATSRRQ